jgi:hypothetical protein
MDSTELRFLIAFNDKVTGFKNREAEIKNSDMTSLEKFSALGLLKLEWEAFIAPTVIASVAMPAKVDK